MPDFVTKQNESATVFSDTLTLSDGTVPPLQGATVQFQARAGTTTAPVALTGTTTLVNPNTGAVQFQPSAADNQPGMYLCCWQVTYATGQVQKFPEVGYLWWSVEPDTAGLPQQIVDLPTVKEHLSMTSIDRVSDARLQRLIGAITPLIEQQTGPIIPRVFEEWHDGGSAVIQLHRYPSSAFGTQPVLQLLAASEYRGPIEYPLAVIASPVYGSIYSLFLNADMGTVTRRTAGGGTIAFMPGIEQVHIWYRAGQAVTPPNVVEAAVECVRVAYQWPQATGPGHLTPSDGMEIGPSLQHELSRLIRTMLLPTRRAPSFA